MSHLDQILHWIESKLEKLIQFYIDVKVAWFWQFCYDGWIRFSGANFWIFFDDLASKRRRPNSIYFPFFYQTLFQRKDNYVGGTAEMKRKSPFEAFVNDLPWPYFSLLASGEVAFKWYSVVRDFIGLFFFSYCRKDTTVVVLQQLFRAEQWIFFRGVCMYIIPQLKLHYLLVK